ncbi:beta-lactamase-like protein [Mycena capillaripes]|nr:beta-lactamase-like protein [Mycena capillaripes]
MKSLILDPSQNEQPTRDNPHDLPKSLPEATHTKVHPAGSNDRENASIYFVGTATTILEWEGIRLMTDPNFLHAGDHVHLGPGVTGTRQTEPAIDLHDLPRIDLVLLSHYHADHFDEKVESSLRRTLPIITTHHAQEHLASKPNGEAFTNVHALESFESMMVDVRSSPPSDIDKGHEEFPAIKVTGMPGKHVPPGPLSVANDVLNAVPPTNGWMVELGHKDSSETFRCGYRIYISGDTLMVDELKEIPERYKDKNINLMLVHLGGTTIPSPKLPLLMVTMDAKQGLELVTLVNADVTIPIHYDDYDVFLSPLEDFKKLVKEAGLSEKVVYLDRKDKYRFQVL